MRLEGLTFGLASGKYILVATKTRSVLFYSFLSCPRCTIKRQHKNSESSLSPGMPAYSRFRFLEQIRASARAMDRKGTLPGGGGGLCI